MSYLAFFRLINYVVVARLLLTSSTGLQSTRYRRPFDTTWTFWSTLQQSFTVLRLSFALRTKQRIFYIYLPTSWSSTELKALVSRNSPVVVERKCKEKIQYF